MYVKISEEKMNCLWFKLKLKKTLYESIVTTGISEPLLIRRET